MATGTDTIPGSTLTAIEQVVHTYVGSNVQTQQDIQRMLSNGLGLGFFSLDLSGANNRACYEEDFYNWTQQTTALIRAGHWSAIDREALAEEVNDLGANLYHAVSSDLYQILIHLLKWQYQPHRRVEGHSWQDSIAEHRDRIERLCAKNPALRRETLPMLTEEYPRARRRASLQTGLPRATFPETCPWPLADVLDPDFWPDASQESHPIHTP